MSLGKQSYWLGTTVAVLSNAGLTLANLISTGIFINHLNAEYQEDVIVVVFFFVIALIFLMIALTSFIWTLIQKSSLPGQTKRYRFIAYIIGLVSIIAVILATSLYETRY